MKRRLLITVLAVPCLALAGCGLQGPTPTPEPTETRSEGTDADLGVRDTRDPQTLTSATSTTGAAEVAVSYALAQATWSASTYARQYERMIRLSTGALRRELTTQRPERDQIDGIRAGGQTSRANVLAADPRAVKDGRGPVIVVLEQYAGQKGRVDPFVSNVIYRVSVQREDGHWRVSRFETVPAAA